MLIDALLGNADVIKKPPDEGGFLIGGRGGNEWFSRVDPSIPALRSGSPSSTNPARTSRRVVLAQSNLMAGSVPEVMTIRSPIHGAYAVITQSQHVMLVDQGAGTLTFNPFRSNFPQTRIL
jgi:hypothetical protein